MSGDFGGLRRIIDEAKQIAEDERTRPLIDCPQCGEPLDENSRGEKNCPLGHGRWPAGTTRGSAGGG